MALSDANDLITLSNYKIKYDLDYYTNKFPAGTLVDLFQICELNFNTGFNYHRFSESMVYTTLSDYKVKDSYNLNNRLVKKSASNIHKFQPTVNSSSFKIEDQSAEFLIKGFSPRPIRINTVYSVDSQYHYGKDSTNTDGSTYKTDITKIRNSSSKYYATSVLNCDYSTSIFIWRQNGGLGVSYEGSFTKDGDNLYVLDSGSIWSSTLYLPDNYQSQMPYVMTCILGGAGGGGSSGVDLYDFGTLFNTGYTRYARYGGAGGGSGATLIMNLSFGTDRQPIGYLIEIGNGGAGGSGRKDATDEYGRGSMQAGSNGGASYIYAYSYNKNTDTWVIKRVNGNPTYFAYAGGGGGGGAIASDIEKPSYASAGAAGTYYTVSQEYFQLITGINGATGGHGGSHPGNYKNARYDSEEDLRSAVLENPPASGDSILISSSSQSKLGYIAFNTMAGLNSSQINFPSNYKINVGTLISHKFKSDDTPYFGAAGGGASSLLALGGLGRAWNASTAGALGSGGGGGDFGTDGGYAGGDGGDGYVIICY